jgi:hypothetical protein
MNCYSAFYIKGTWSERRQNVSEVAMTIADLFSKLKNFDHLFDNLLLLMNENQGDSFYELVKHSYTDLQHKLINDILLKSTSAIKEFYPGVKPNPQFSEAIGFKLYFFSPG